MSVTSCNNIPTGVAGIVGGTETAIDANTKNIVLDSGNYNQTMVRKTSRALKIHNETVARTDKFLHPKNNELAVKRATKLILELAGGEVYENGDYYPNKRTTQKMDIREQRIQKLSGMTIDLVEAAESLKRLGYSVVEQDNTKLVVEWPHFRTDIEVEDDIVADILRMYNYMNIPISLINEAPPTDITPELVRFENTLVNILLTLGLDEHITDSLVKQDATQSQVKLLSVLTEDKNALRSNLVGSLEKVAFNYKKHKHREIGLFEVGKVFLEPKTEKSIVTVYYENTDLGIYDSSNKLKSLFSGLMHKLDIKTYELCELAGTPINEKISVRIQGDEVGELTPNSFTLDTEILMKFRGKNSHVTTEISNNIIENVSILLPSTLAFGPILANVKSKTDGVQDIIVLEEHILDQNLGQKAILLSVVYATQNPDLAAKSRENLFNNLSANEALKIRN